MRRCGSFAILLTALAALALCPEAARAEGPEELLTGKGLKRLGTQFVLPGETDLNKMFRDIAGLKKELADATKIEQLVEQKAQVNDKLITQYTQQRILLRQQLASATSVEQHNQIVNALNELGDRITLLMEGGEHAQELKNARTKANQAREKYIQHVLALRALYDKLQGQYEDLAADPKVAESLAALAEGDKKYVLGPTRTFASNGNMLKKIEDTVLSESISLRRSDGDVFYVSTVFNDKHVQELVVDTGASIVVLPAKMASDMGIEIDSQALDIQLQMADGRIAEAKQVMLDKVRVGKFELEQVECAVMDAEYTEAAAVLGQSFLRHFSFKIDPTDNKLIMTKVEDSSRR